MKNLFKKSLLVLGTALITSVTVLASVNYSLYINGEKVDAKIIVENGTTYVPLRLVGEKLNADIRVVNGVISVDSNVIIQEDIGTMIYNNREYPLPKGISENYTVEDTKEIRPLTDEEKQLIDDVKQVLNKEIVIENGQIYEIENGQKTRGADASYFKGRIETKLEENRVREKYENMFNNK